MTRIAHHTWDEVNFWSLEQLVQKHGIEAVLQEPRDGLACDGSALLIDANFWWTDPAERAVGITQLIGLYLSGPVAVHGGHLTDELLQQLREHGLLCSNTLDENLIAALVAEMTAWNVAAASPRVQVP